MTLGPNRRRRDGVLRLSFTANPPTKRKEDAYDLFRRYGVLADTSDVRLRHRRRTTSRSPARRGGLPVTSLPISRRPPSPSPTVLIRDVNQSNTR